MWNPAGGRETEDALAVADYRRRKAEGTLGEGVPHEEVRRMLGLSPLSPTADSQPTGSRNSSRFPTGSYE
ncbi:hypothetical protein GCM10022233_67200 [Streptomyces shaanxiensis]|uniref:Transposase n=1 Tax=Streptomyces shaanxiensis TaxID=653357 RepID=A0ABP7W0F5_9ACTN